MTQNVCEEDREKNHAEWTGKVYVEKLKKQNWRQ